MKLKVQAQHLQPGDIVGSGEKVVFAINDHLKPKQTEVRLEKNGKQRTGFWGKYTTINIERNET